VFSFGAGIAEDGKLARIMDPHKNKVELWEPLIPDEKNKCENQRFCSQICERQRHRVGVGE
jgi:hypothetical protein